MKRYYYLFGFTLLLSFLVNHALAQANYASVTNFEVLPQYLNPATGKIKIDPYSPTTTIKCKVSFVRARGQFNSWLEANMIVGLVSATMDATTVFNETKHITEASFPNEVAYLNDVIMTVVLERSKLGFGKIELMYARGPSFTNAPRYPLGYICNYELYYDPVIGVPPAFTAPEVGSVPLYEYVFENKRELTTKYYSSYPGYRYKGVFGYVFTSTTPGTVPLHRYINSSNGNNYYTLNSGTYTGYTYGGITCYVYANQATNSFPVYENYSSSGVYHRYSYYPDIFPGYTSEGIKFYILQNLTPAPIYQFYYGAGHDHFASPDINATVGLSGWQSFGVDFKAYNIPAPGTVPVYLFYNDSEVNHYISTNRNAVNGYANWQYMGISFYAYSTQVPGTIPIYLYVYNQGSGNHYTTSNPNIHLQFPGWLNYGVTFYAYPKN